jgi:hypothetical protein
MRAMCSITRAPILIRRSRIVVNSALEGRHVAPASERVHVRDESREGQAEISLNSRDSSNFLQIPMRRSGGLTIRQPTTLAFDCSLIRTNCYLEKSRWTRHCAPEDCRRAHIDSAAWRVSMTIRTRCQTAVELRPI